MSVPCVWNVILDVKGRKKNILEFSHSVPLHNTKDGMGDRSEFVELCSKAGRQACEQGQYREAIRLLHLGLSDHLGPDVMSWMWVDWSTVWGRRGKLDLKR